MSTSNDLPPELLQLIFEAVVDDWDEQPGRRWSSLMQFHSTIRLVSRSWNATALHTPSIWRNIPLHRGFVDYAQFCLSLSGNYPLHVQASVSEAFRELITEERAKRVVWLEVEDKEAYRPWMEVLVALPINGVKRMMLHSLCSPWEEPLALFERNTDLCELEITRFFHQPLNPPVPSPRPTLGRLKKLKISDWAQETQVVLSSFSAPNLETLHLLVNDEHRYGQRIRPMTLAAMDMFESVKEITFQYAITTEDVLAVLRHTPNVESLRLSHSWRFQSTFDDLLGRLANPHAPTVLAPRLQVLSIHEFPVWMPAILGLARARLSRSQTSLGAFGGGGQKVLPLKCVELSEWTMKFYPEADIERLREVCEVRVWEPPPGEIR